MRLFISGPFFSEEQVQRLEKVKKALEGLGYSVYSTFHENARIDLSDQKEKNDRFVLMCREIAASDGVFGILDGRDPGTIWELGYAYAIGKPIIVFGEKDHYFSLMLDQCAAYIAGFDMIDGGLGRLLAEKDAGRLPKYDDYFHNIICHHLKCD